uniref:Zinc phosphodiesterase ELAC protein 2 n=1 Tax=Lates calcarifer TaxID=8187 RepID=A0A4W6FJ99_LATCA
VFSMNTVRLKLRSFTFLFVKSRARPADAHPPLARWDSRTVFQFCRTMTRQQLDPRKARQKEPLRRLKIRENRNKRGFDDHGPSTVYLQVVGAGSRDNAASLYVFSEFNRYRLHTWRLKVYMSVFNLDSFPVVVSSGMILTLKDTGVPECVLYGPPQLEKYLNAIKTFSGPLDDIKLSVRPYTEEAYTDDTMTVHQVPIFGEFRSVSYFLILTSASESVSNRELIVTLQLSQRITAGNTPPGRAAPLELHPKKGNFLVTQAKELGLPVGTAAIGPLVKALKAGESITFEGREIRPEQVCTPTDPGPVFIIIECPSEEFVQPVCTNQHLRRYQTGGTEDPAVLVVHMTPESVLNTDQYKQWMERFPSTTEHLILNQQVFTVHNVRSHKIQTQLNMIHPEIFPQLRSYRTKEPQAALHVPNVRAECLLKFQLRPVMEWQRDAIPSCSTEEFVKEASEVPNFLEEVEKSRKICSTDAAELSGKGDKYPEVVFLGTGSALPMKIRNVSGTLVNISSTQSLLLDCGEGTFGQLCRHYGDDVDDALSKISTVFISHLHADHHTGLLNLLYQRERAMTTLGKEFSPIYLIAPVQIMTWLNRYHDHCEEILSHINVVPNTFLTDDAEVPKQKTKSLIKALLKKNDLTKFQTCGVRHCKNAFACSFTHQSGWKLAFSGDTMPCDALCVFAGKDATLLIHEATLEDGMEEEAVEKRHSTTSQAIGIGMRMNAEFIMLNHFSQRYAKIPLFSEDFSDKVGISFDHMRIRFGDLKILPRLIPAVKTLFADDIEEMEERRERRERRELRHQRHQRGGSSEVNSEQQRTTTGRGAKRDQEEAATHDVDAKRQKTSFSS